MSILDWILIGLGIFAVALYLILKIKEFKQQKKEFLERKAKGEDPAQIKADMQKKTKKHKKAITTDDEPFED